MMPPEHDVPDCTCPWCPEDSVPAVGGDVLSAAEREAIEVAAGSSLPDGHELFAAAAAIKTAARAAADEEARGRLAAVEALAAHLASQTVGGRCDLIAFPGDVSESDKGAWREGRGQCIHDAVAVRWEDGFADEVCEGHAANARRERGALVVYTKRHDGTQGLALAAPVAQPEVCPCRFPGSTHSPTIHDPQPGGKYGPWCHCDGDDLGHFHRAAVSPDHHDTGEGRESDAELWRRGTDYPIDYDRDRYKNDTRGGQS